ncbi:hypothetical protein ACFOKI_01360 [Sphingomonas qilianensis]|uniref:Uncharacterized protein n=1 Tax=Sphingomonas qilianensis TaxID=1736690 RepID=A0ABU9XSF8_9SPHN
MITNYTRSTDVAGVSLGYMLHALSAKGRYAYVRGNEFPDAAILVEDRGAVICVTAAPAPKLRDVINAFAQDLRYDVALVRITGQDRDFIRLSIDLTLGLLPCEPWAMHDLELWTGRTGDTWFVPEGFCPAISLTSDGFSLELLPPYNTLAERSAGILRAAADVASLLPMTEAR